MSLLYSINPSTKCDVSALFRCSSPCNIFNRCITLLFHQGTRVFITFQANGLKIFLLASLTAAFTSLVLKSQYHHLYISFSIAYKPSHSVLGENVQNSVLENKLTFSPQTVFRITCLMEGREALWNRGSQIFDQWFWPVVLAFIYCLLA